MRFRTSIQLPDDNRRELIELLNGVLSQSIDLYTQAKQAHWNVKGRRFISAHELFEDVAKHLSEHSDDIAERVAALGGFVRGTARQVAEHSDLPEFNPDSLSAHDCLEALVEHLAAHSRTLRECIERSADELKDPITEDLLVEVLREVEFDLWLLETHLEDPSRTHRTAAPTGEEAAAPLSS